MKPNVLNTDQPSVDNLLTVNCKKTGIDWIVTDVHESVLYDHYVKNIKIESLFQCS